MKNLIYQTAHQLADLLAKGEVTSVEITEAFLDHIDKHNSYLNAYITITADKALEQAQAADKRIKSKSTLSLLDGVPIAIKDNFLTKGIRTTNASAFYKNFIPPYESTITQKLIESGMVTLGKTNMDQFAMGSDNTTSFFGPVVNPWKCVDGKAKVPGGSSGGSAAAVAGRLAPWALGTDTGGSIRQPAAFCGLVGMKPTYGVCSRYGIFSFASSLDQAGPISTNVIDNALLLNMIAGVDDKDSTMLNESLPDLTSEISQFPKKLTVGIIKEYKDFGISPDIQKNFNDTLKILGDLGVTVKEISFPEVNYALPVYYVIAPVEAASNFARYDGVRYGERAESNNLLDLYKYSRFEGFSNEVKSRVLIGTYNVLQENFDIYIKACKLRTLIIEEYRQNFKEVDFILTPTTAGTAFNLHDNKNSSSLELYYNDIFTVGVNLAGLPAISVPSGISSEGLPIGMQFIGNHYSEKALYQIAYALEQELNFNVLPQLIR